MTNHPNRSRRRHLTCAVCDGDAGYWEQHWNRDTGYGICRSCVDWCEASTSREQMLDYYGVEGVNYEGAGVAS